MELCVVGQNEFENRPYAKSDDTSEEQAEKEGIKEGKKDLLQSFF